MVKAPLQAAAEALRREAGAAAGDIRSSRSVGGGNIHGALRLVTAAGPFFLKYNRADVADMFATEARGLGMLREAGPLRVPEVIAHGQDGQAAFLLTEWIEKGHMGHRCNEAFGRGLAALHGHSRPEFGLDHDNYIGRLPQSNTFDPDWIAFFIGQRLEPQLQRAEQNGFGALRAGFERLYPRLRELIPAEPPALLHGDLWYGNAMADAQEQPVIYDPAVYYGHREAELAFMRLFHGFDAVLFEAYAEAKPLQKGWESRIGLFNLYPLMVHLNLFGRTYLPDIREILDRYI